MKKLLTVILSASLAMSILAGCSGGKESESGEKSLDIGVLAPLTGVNAEYGEGFDIASKMALETLDNATTSNGYKINLVLKDSKGDPKEGSDLARLFGDREETIAILGDFTSSSAMANAPIVDAAGIVQLSPTASNPDYAAMSDYCFGIIGRQDNEAPFFAERVLGNYMDAKDVGVVYINSDWGLSCYDNFMIKADEIGLNVVETVNYVQDEKDFSSLITKLKAADPEVIAIMDQGAVPQVINQIRSIGWDVPITTIGPGTSQQVLDLSGENAEGLVLSTPFFYDPQDEVLTGWKDEFVSRSGFEPTVHPAFAYDATLMLIEAIEACGDEEVTREKVRDNLAAIEFNGITGPIKFNEAGDVNREYVICAVENGEYVLKEGFGYSE